MKSIRQVLSGLILAVVTVMLVAAPASAATSTKISSTPTTFPTTDGRIYSATISNGYLFIGGNFTHVISADGKTSVAATNLAAIKINSPATIKGFSAPHYVWALAHSGSSVYYGGQGFLGSLSASSLNYGAWHPTISSTNIVHGIGGSSTGIGVALSGGAKLYNSAGTLLWSKTTQKGQAHTMRYMLGAWYVGGSFGGYDNVTRQGIVKVSTTTGTVITSFDAKLPPTTVINPANNEGNGYSVLSMTSTSDSLALGVGGQSNRVLWINPTTGARKLTITANGDVQGITTVGTRVVDGTHSNNNHTTGHHRFGISYDSTTGSVGSWDPGFGQTDFADTADNSHGGVQVLVYDTTSKLLFVGGDQTHTGDYSQTAWGNGSGTARRSLAAFKVTP